MAQEDTFASGDANGRAGGNDPANYGLEQARADVVEAIETQGLQPSAEDAEGHDDLVKVGNAGLSFELRFNGQTIALDGKDVNVLTQDGYQDFLKRQKLAAEAGEFDDQIREALGHDGPMKALARVRAVDDASGS